MRKKKTVTCDVGIAQCKDRTVKCEKKVTGIACYLLVDTVPLLFFGGYHRITLKLMMVV